MKKLKFYSFVPFVFGLILLVFSLSSEMKYERSNSEFLSQDTIPDDTIPGDTISYDTIPSGDTIIIPAPINIIPNDSTVTDNGTGGIISPPSDLSSSFDERGFYKSNSFSKNGNEIINDFNGNLCYSIPLATGKGRGDLFYDLSINYNGNVNYQIISANASEPYWNFTHLHIYNLSAPGWIFSLNGLAVQMLNFETNYFTRPSGVGINAYGKDVRLLASGYHITDVLTTPTNDQKDKITIMLGDGSTETLENTQCSEPNVYIGTYLSTTKNSFMKAKVIFNPDLPAPQQYEEAGKLRIMYLMKGDGLTYIYKEYYLNYKDHHLAGGMASWFYPTTFMLTSIKDRFGHEYTLEYDLTTQYGRPFLKTCPGANFSFPNNWGTYNGLKVAVRGENNYIFNTDPFRLDAEEVHRPKLKYIINPSGEIMNFSYEPYERIGNNLYDKQGYNNMSIKLENINSPLYRLSQVQNFDGGKRIYKYRGPNLLSLDYHLSWPDAGVHSSESYYLGQGRDLFFSNMLDSATEMDNSQYIKKVVYDYTYLHSFRNSEYENIWQYPIDSSDTYISKKSVISLNDDFLYNTISSFNTIKTYRNYRIKAVPEGEILDFTGTTKLAEEKFFEGNQQNEYKKVNYYYNSGAPSGQNQLFSGTFLDSIRVENNGGASRTWKYNYIGGDTVPISMKKETDPMGRIITTNFTRFEKPEYKVYEGGTFNYNLGKIYDTVYFYLIQQPVSIAISKGTDTLEKKVITYYDPDNVTGSTIVDGYAGQVKEEKDMNPQSTSTELRNITYKYYNKDTISSYIHTYATWVNPDEGNMKEITDANGNKTKLYYDIISRSEDETYANSNCANQNYYDQYACPKALSYHKLKDNGTDIIETSDWRDFRFPSRIDNYVDGNRYLTHYQLYNEVGCPTKVLNENKYLSQAEYDGYFRLKCLTLPGDFGNINPDIDTVVLKDTSCIYLLSNSNAWGRHNSTLSYSEIYMATDGYFGNILYDYYLNAPEGTNFTKQDALVLFNRANFNKINILDSAFLEFAPFYISAKLDGQYTTNYDFRINPITSIQWSGFNNNATYTAGSYYASGGNLNVSNSNSCSYGNISEMIQRYDSNFRKIDVTNILTPYVLSNGLNVFGLKFSIPYSGSSYQNNGHINTEMSLCHDRNCSESGYNNNYMYNTWYYNYSPKLRIYSRKILFDTILTVHYNSGSLIYEYDESNNKVTTLSKIDKPGTANRYKTVDNYFDGFGYLKQSNIYTGYRYDSIQTKYNYLYQKAKSIDARGNSTKFSYDKYGGLSRTENADVSVNQVSNTFLSSYSTTFYNISNGFVSKQVYTDETGRSFEKYFDAVGNLLREVKYISHDTQIPDNPFDPDTTYSLNDAPGDVALTTDYNYDNLYRVIEIKTPSNKRIYYTYDVLGRQSSRTTPDAGTTGYIYDKNNNLIYSQDANQRVRGTNIFTFRNYDGLNRLLSIGEIQQSSPSPVFDSLVINPEMQFDNIGNQDQMLTVNVYDSLVYYSTNIFTNPPSDYYSTGTNNTKGALVATAYRTKVSDSWNYKYYKYDARGRVIKMWHYIDGLGWKTQLYNYNSQNQVTCLNYNPSNTDGKMFCYAYDSTDRLQNVNIYNGMNSEEMNEDYPGEYFNYAAYDYNENSQISHFKFNNNTNNYQYDYNNRNWIHLFANYTGTNNFAYQLNYLLNGNIRSSVHGGIYTSLFSNNPLSYTYVYDKSNRLLKTDFVGNQTVKTFDVSMAYDYDGNISTLKRYGSNENLIDSLTYNYYINTNKLQNVTGSGNQYFYDANGNLTGDERDANSVKQNMKYDQRNLLIEMRVVVPATIDPNQDPNTSNPNEGEIQQYQIYFKYDEAGNRTRKSVYHYQGMGPVPAIEEDNIGGGWTLVTDEYYSRDISGKEIAVYQSTNLDHWNVWGTDNVGKINADGHKFFYLKDHLGSIRVVLDESNNITSAEDLDCWGYPLEGRSYVQVNNNGGTTDYKFTGKQRDTETGYDYFGARYYDARIARWGGVEPLLEKYISYSPYQYGLLNPFKLIDVNGSDVKISGDYATQTAIAIFESTTSKFFVSFDPKTGFLSCEGTPGNEQEKLLEEAINDKNRTVELFTTDANDDNLGFPFAVGEYYGSQTDEYGEYAQQIFNYNHSKGWEAIGGSNPGMSAIHEILEAYMGAILFPDQGYGDKKENIEKLKNNKNIAHNYVVGLENPKQKYPIAVYYGDINKKHYKTVLKVLDNNRWKYTVIFGNSEKANKAIIK